MSLEDELGCEGFFGFGGGYDRGKGVRRPNDALYCSGTCKRARTCWTKHMARVESIFPASTALFKRVARRFGGQRAVALWAKKYKMTEPYSSVSVGNITDGMAIAAGKLPEDRGPATLPWPFRIHA